MADFACGAARDLPLDMDTAWDGAAAKAGMFEWAGGDSLDSAKLRRGFLVYDCSAPELRGSYHLPFAAVKSGILTALASGCRAAASRLEQMDGLSSEVHDKARAVLDAYFAKINDKGEKSLSLEGEYQAPRDWLPIRLPTLAERAQTSLDSGELLNLAKQRAQDPSIFDTYPPVFFPGVVSTNALDSYSTRMHRSSLENFAADLSEGRVLLDSHDSGRLGIGYSLRGRYVGAGGNGVQRTQADFFSAPTSDDAATFIRKMQAGMVRDLSAGFYGGQWVCDLCGQNMMRGTCTHWPGHTYEQDGKSQPVMATATIHHARLAETSAVYDGSTPGAMIMRARQMSEAGLIVPEMARLLEAQYRIRLPESQRAWAGATLPAPTEEPMAETPAGTPAPTEPTAPLVALRSLLTEAGLTVAADPFETVRALTAELLKLRTLKAECDRLRPLADMGTKYHADERERAIEEGIRAQGAAFPTETFKSLLERSTLAEVQALAAGWKATADAQFGGGRTSQDVGEPDPGAANGKVPAIHTPAGAYAG